MKLFIHYSFVGFSNTYIFGPENGGNAVIVDPGVMDVELLNMIEDNHYYIRSILITHNHESHVKAIKTIKKIYQAALYSKVKELFGFQCEKVTDGKILPISEFIITPIEIPGHSHDSLAFKVGDILFTGDALEAGRMSGTPNNYARSILMSSIQKKLSSLDDSTIVFPGHGPPSILKAEKKYNPSFTELPDGEIS